MPPTLGESGIYAVFAHPLRSRILKHLGEHGPTRSTELRRELDISVGTLYYHLDVLGELVTQDQRKRYLLTDLGAAALDMVASRDESISAYLPRKARLPLVDAVAPFISGSLLFRYILESPKRHLVEAVLIVVLGAWLHAGARLLPEGVFLLQTPATSLEATLMRAVTGWLLTFLAVDLVAAILFRRSGGRISLLVGVAISQLPLIAFSGLWIATRSAFFVTDFDSWLLRIGFFGFQVWSLVLLGSVVRLSKGLSGYKAAFVVMVFAYLNVAYSTLLRGFV
ncbi:MAG: winged helix-turn-helix domain-containing protein [Candidatus Geothermarchaeales archaeon]